MRCPRTMWPSSCASMAARLASSGSTSINPRLSTMLCPSVNDSSVEVINTRQRTSGWMSRSFVTSRLLTTVSRSEEHTSELQSHSDLVCRLLLEKKKKTNNEYDTQQA